MILDIGPFKKAVSQLEKAIQYAESDMAKNDSDLFEQFRGSTIQAFEYTFELAWKMLKRYFDWNQGIKEHNLRNLFREGG